MAIVNIEQKTQPSVQDLGSQQRRVHQVRWEVETDVRQCSDETLLQAQISTVGDGPIPTKGYVLTVENGIVVAALRANVLLNNRIKLSTGLTARESDLAVRVTAWVGVDTTRFADGGVKLLDLVANPTEPGPTKHHEIIGTYRTPNSAELERSGWLDQFQAGLPGNMPVPAAIDPIANPKSTDATAILTALDPVNKPRQFLIDYVTQESGLTEVFPVQRTVRTIGSPDGVNILPKRIFRNPLGEVYPPLPDVTRIQIITVEEVVPDNQFAWQMNAVWDRTINADEITTWEGFTIPRFHARFLYAETSRIRTDSGTGYHVLTYRVEVQSKPYFEFQPAFGSYFLAQQVGPLLPGQTRGLVPTTEKDIDGNPIFGPYPLTSTGEKAGPRGEGQHVDEFTRYTPKAYGAMLQ